MPFKKGEKIPGQGRKKGSGAAQVKAKFITEWSKIFRQEGRNILEALAKEQPLEFCKCQWPIKLSHFRPIKLSHPSRETNQPLWSFCFSR